MDTIAFWKEYALSYIKPNRGSEFPESKEALSYVTTLIGTDNVLDLGCGRGRLTQLFNKSQYTGLDVSGKALHEARLVNHGYTFDVWDTKSKLPTSTFVFLNTVLLHISDKDIDTHIENICGSTTNVIVSEVMDSTKCVPTGIPPAFNRNKETYVELFAKQKFACVEIKEFVYETYDFPITIIHFRKDNGTT